jgi:hypothetical protein
MASTRSSHFALAALSVVALAAIPLSSAQAQTVEVQIDNDDIGGVVTGPSGPEAGVWVIAETRDLPSLLSVLVVLVYECR